MLEWPWGDKVNIIQPGITLSHKIDLQIGFSERQQELNREEINSYVRYLSNDLDEKCYQD